MDTSQFHDALSSNVTEEEKNVSFESTGSDAENLEAIKKFIEEQEKEIQESKDEGKISTKSAENADTKDKEGPDESFEVATKVMDMILTESEEKIDKQQVDNASKQELSPIAKGDHKIIRSNDKGNGSMSLYIGSKVEAKDFEEDWYAAEIVEVDYEDMEVLVRYEPEWKKLDEWINVSSPRLRPYTGNTVKPGDKESEVKEAKDSTNEKNPASQNVDEPIKELDEPKEELKPEVVKTEDKPKIVFEVGERCLARWRDNRRFVATVHKDLGDGKFEVIFDDGVHWTCSVTRMHKMKADKNDALHIDTTFQASVGSPSPLETPGTNHPPISPSIPPAFHTHLFDPTRDYLGSKSERREKKRKLNIKEIFNIDQRKNKIPKKEKPKTPVEKKPRAPKKDIAKVPKLELKKMTKVELLKKEIKTEVPDAVASIIGSIKKEEPVSEIKSELDMGRPECSEKESIAEDLNENIEKLTAEVGKISEEIQEYKDAIDIMEPEGVVVDPNDKTLDDEDTEEPKSEGDPVLEEEVTLENFEKKDVQEHEEAIDKIKEAIIKLEDGLNDIENQGSPKVIRAGTPKTEAELPPGNSKEMMTLEDLQSLPESVDITVVDTNIDNLDLDESPSEESRVPQTPEKISKSKKDPTRIKKSKKLRLMHEKKVKKDVERVKNELARMKRKFEEMRREMLEKQWELAKSREMPERVSEEWCCKWVNGQPVGKVSEIEAPPSLGSDDPPALPRRSVQVQDKRLPPGWSKHMVRRSAGHSAGKWHVVLASPKECGSKKFYTKADMRVFLENFPDESLKPYEHALMDFGVHLKLSRQLGWIVNTPDGIAEGPDTILPAGSSSLSPQPSRNKMKLKKRSLMMKDKRLVKRDKKRRPIKLKLQRGLHTYNSQIVGGESSSEIQMEPVDTMLEQMPLEDGYVYVGSLKVQIIENLLRCPAEGCFKNFRTKTLLQMHIKHYHRELKAMMGATPKVLDLAYARTMPNDMESPPPEKKIIKVKIQKPVKRTEEPKPQIVDPPEMPIDTFPIKAEEMLPKIPRSQDSPKLRHALINSNKPVKRPRVLLPVRRPEPEPSDSNDDFDNTEPAVDTPALDQALDFETAISTHTVTKPAEKRKKVDKKKSFASMSKNISEDEEMFAMVSDDFDTRSSFPRSGSPDSKLDMKTAPVSSESNDDLKDNNQMYTYNDGERVKIVHMKREEIINCHCGIREEDGLMVQCELCLCWQHALCHNIQRESEVPEKYTCSICLNPRRGRRSRRFVHDQDRLYEGALVGGRAREPLRRAHELAGNLLRAQDALHALRLKGYVASKKSHPKLYLWAKDWEQAETSYSPDKLNSEYSAMHAMINGIGKENLPMRSDDDVDISTPPSEEQDQVGMSRDSQLGPHSLLSGLLSSDLLNTPEFNSLADSVQESSDWQRTAAPVPVPEAAIENDACRERLLRHIERCHALIDARLESIEAQVAELESREPSFGEHYETADYYPQTKQTIQMLMRDLDNMEELGVIT